MFKGFKPKERHAAIKSIKACFLCFGAHRTTACPRKDRKCGVCGKSNHNDLLCFKSESTSNGHCESSKPPETTKDGYETSAGTNENTMLHIMKVAGAEKNTSLNVFFDDGSKGNFITHDAAKRHNCPSENITVDVTLLNNVVETLETVKYRVGIRERNGKIRYIYAYGTDKVTGDISQVDMKIISQIFPDLTQAQLKNLERPSGAVDLLIGNFYSAWQPTRTLGKGHLSIMSNCFGRCISGSHPKLSIGSSERRICPDVFNERTTAQRVGVSTHTQLVSTRHTPNQSMDSNVSSNQLSWPTCGGCQCGRGCYGGWDQERGEVHTQAHATSIRHQQPSLQHSERDSFFRAENLGVEVVPKCGGCRCGKCPIPGHTYSFQEEQELLLIRKGLQYDAKNEVWTATYPWIVNRDALPNNYDAAYAALRRLERNQLKDPEWKRTYADQIQDMINRKAARYVTLSNLRSGKALFTSSHILQLSIRSPKLHLCESVSTPVKNSVSLAESPSHSIPVLPRDLTLISIIFLGFYVDSVKKTLVFKQTSAKCIMQSCCRFPTKWYTYFCGGMILDWSLRYSPFVWLILGTDLLAQLQQSVHT